ncbi:hypothetical protein HanHA89_Chr12g0475641 [Helianthus annuus]|nr:hypothetical protein HanHA89_Chr12g0475641 [Helianthus annuus]
MVREKKHTMAGEGKLQESQGNMSSHYARRIECEFGMKICIGSSCPPLLTYRSNYKAMLTALDGDVQLVIDYPYLAGQSVVV